MKPETKAELSDSERSRRLKKAKARFEKRQKQLRALKEELKSLKRKIIDAIAAAAHVAAVELDRAEGYLDLQQMNQWNSIVWTDPYKDGGRNPGVPEWVDIKALSLPDCDHLVGDTDTDTDIKVPLEALEPGELLFILEQVATLAYWVEEADVEWPGLP